MNQKIANLITWLTANPRRLRNSSSKIQKRCNSVGEFTIEEIQKARTEANCILVEQYGSVRKAIGKVIKVVEKNTKDIRDIKDKITNFSEDLKTGKAEITGVLTSEIKDLQDLITKCNIDLTKWDVVKYVQNFWGNENYPCWQVKAFLEPKQIKEVDVIEKLLANYKSNWTPINRADIFINDAFGRPCCSVIDLTDFHLDKKTLTGDTLKDRILQYYKVLNDLLFSAYRFCKMEEIFFVVGSDFFHTDSYGNTTTAGTPLEVNSSWDEAYESGFDMQVKTVSKLKQFCEKLTIIHVRGNHDLQKSYYLAHALAQYFKNDSQIVFDRSSENRKAIAYGPNFIGFHHGNCKIKELPVHFARQFGKMWGNSTYQEIKVGDKHFYFEQEIAGVRVKQLPSLSGTDRWHDDNNFINSTKSGIISIYRKDKPGRFAEFEESIE